MVALYISIIMLCRVVQAIFNKMSSNEVKSIKGFVGYEALKHSISTALGVILVLIAEVGFKADIKTVLIAGFSGLTLFASGFCSIYGMKSGTVSLNSMFGTAGMLVPMLAGIFLFGIPVSLMQWLGVAIFFFSAWLLIGSSKQVYKFSFKTMLLLIGSLLANGGTMLAQQLFTQWVPDGDVSIFSMFSFGIIAILSGIAFLFIKPGKAESAEKTKMSKKLMISAVALAIAVFIINQLATISTALLPPAVLFAFINGGGTIISTIVAAIMYKEKLTLRTALGVIIGIASLVIIKIF